VLVVGGSQGAAAVNAIAAQALITLAGEHQLAITHQTGTASLDETSARYRDAGISADVRPFVQDMATAYAQADVIVSRAGATTVAELAIAGKPAIFIPYPTAADNHQEINAREMTAAGASLVFRQAELTPAILAESLRNLLSDPELRARMGSAMKRLARPDAAGTVAGWCQAQAQGKR
jgi:UDP-N-acetylglucosamine--N-acetylmuramyl-(pentapeptide) pyrophosphoryl-undecaprenol N-acetylglucosamine transferase